MTPPKTNKATLVARIRIVILLGLGLLCAFAFWVGSRAFRSEYRSLAGGAFEIPESEKAGLPPVVEVSWVTNGKTVRGWLARGSGSRAVLLVHGSGGSRLSTKDELVILSNAGFTVLAYDQPGHGESDGPVSYGTQRREGLRGAVRFLKSQPGVEKVGALGLSYGGYDLIQTALTTPDIAFLAVGGTPGDILAHAQEEYQGAFGLRLLGARVAMHLFEIPLNETSAEVVVPELAPRPILFLYGKNDPAVSRPLAARLYEAARPPKTWVELPESGHCDYASKDRDLYTKVLMSFFADPLSLTDRSQGSP